MGTWGTAEQRRSPRPQAFAACVCSKRGVARTDWGLKSSCQHVITSATIPYAAQGQWILMLLRGHW